MVTLYIQPDKIIIPDRKFEDQVVVVRDGLIVDVGLTSGAVCSPGASRIEAEGLTLAPGFTDLQLNGAFGHDFTANPASIWEVARRLPMYGVTSLLPTIITSPDETVVRAQEAWLRDRRPASWGPHRWASTSKGHSSTRPGVGRITLYICARLTLALSKVGRPNRECGW